MNERRSYQRFNVSLKIIYRVVGWNESRVGLCTNIGRSGVCIVANEHLNVGTPLEVEFAPLHSEFKKPIVMKGDVAWVREVSAKDEGYQMYFKESSLPWKKRTSGTYLTGFNTLDEYYEVGIRLAGINSYDWIQLFQYIPSIEMFDEQWSSETSCNECVHYQKIDNQKGNCFGVDVMGKNNPRDEQCGGKYYSKRRGSFDK